MINTHNIQANANEYSVLMAIWNAGTPLTAKEIVAALPDKGFKDSAIHFILNGMLDKGLIYVDGTKLTSRIYSRCFNASVSFDEYHSNEIKTSAMYIKNRGLVLTGIVSRLIDDNIEADTLEKLEKLIEEKKMRLSDDGDSI